MDSEDREFMLLVLIYFMEMNFTALPRNYFGYQCYTTSRVLNFIFRVSDHSQLLCIH